MKIILVNLFMFILGSISTLFVLRKVFLRAYNKRLYLTLDKNKNYTWKPINYSFFIQSDTTPWSDDQINCFINSNNLPDGNFNAKGYYINEDGCRYDISKTNKENWISKEVRI